MLTFISQFLHALIHLLSAPFRNFSILWQIIPLLLMWILLQVYFGKWKETLGWNSALSNAITLFWTVAAMMQIIFDNNKLFSLGKFLILLFIMLYSIVLMYIVFKHDLKDKITFIIASPIGIYYLSMIIIIWTNGLIKFNWYMLLAILFLFSIFIIIDFILKKILGDKDENNDPNTTEGDEIDKNNNDENNEFNDNNYFNSNKSNYDQSFNKNHQPNEQPNNMNSLPRNSTTYTNQRASLRPRRRNPFR